MEEIEQGEGCGCEGVEELEEVDAGLDNGGVLMPETNGQDKESEHHMTPEDVHGVNLGLRVERVVQVIPNLLRMHTRMHASNDTCEDRLRVAPRLGIFGFA